MAYPPGFPHPHLLFTPPKSAPTCKVCTNVTRWLPAFFGVGTRWAIVRVRGAIPRDKKANCFSRFLCLPLVCAVSVLHILCVWWLKLSSQWKSTHWVQGFVTSCFCLVFDSSTVVAEHGSVTESGGVTGT